MYLVIDIGSNTIRAVVFRLEKGRPVAVLNKKYSAGLSSYVESGKIMAQEGIEKCVEVLSEIKLLIDAFNFDGVYTFATAAIRNIKNSDEVLSAVKKNCDIDIKILSGKEEAYYDYCGAVEVLGEERGVLIDVGGGSTEFVCYDNKKLISSISLQFGSLNIFNKYVNGIIPTLDELQAIDKDVRKALKSEEALLSFADEKSPIKLCAVGGSARAIQKLHKAVFHSSKTENCYNQEFLKDILNGAGDEKILSLLLKSAPERIHTFFPGTAVIYAASRFFGAENILTAQTGVREGYLYCQLKKEGLIHE